MGAINYFRDSFNAKNLSDFNVIYINEIAFRRLFSGISI